MSTIAPFSRNMYVMTKPVGAACNMECKYCYYLEKKNLYKGAGTVMSDSLLEKFIKDYIESQTLPQVMFTWHGGEPLLLPISFYERVIRLQEKYGAGRQIDNCIQTNGTLLNDDWARFFHNHGWLVGVSIDGPQQYHDLYRKMRNQEPSFTKVLRGIECLDRCGAEWNAMAVINNVNADHPAEFYRFFKSIGCHYIQFTPIVERIVLENGTKRLANIMDKDAVRLAEWSVSPEQWGRFLCRLFDEWKARDIGVWFIQIFDSILANWVGMPPGNCSYAPYCGHAGVMEHNGDVYCCDHFVFPQYRLGNIMQNTLVKMMFGMRQQEFGRSKRESLPVQCRQCKWLRLCNGECPKNRFAVTADGESGLNYLCEGYRRFFEHSAPVFERLALSFKVR